MPDRDQPSERTAGASTLHLGDELARFRDYRPGDEQQIVDVYRAAFEEFYPATKPVDEAGYIRWFAEPHTSHEARLTVAEIGARIVAATGSIRREIRIAQRPFYGTAGGIGTCVHPDYQGRKIQRAFQTWRQATHARRTTATLIRSLVDPRAPTALGDQIGVFRWVRRPEPFSWQHHGWRAPPRYLALAGLAAWGATLRALGRRGLKHSVLPVQRFDSRFEALCQRAYEAWDLIAAREVEYLNWRYCDPRAGRFRVRAIEERGEPAGYAVLHALGSRLHLVDLMTLPARYDVTLALVSDALDQSQALGASSVECWLPRRSPHAKVLRRLGFLERRRSSAEVGEEIHLIGMGLSEQELRLVGSPDARIHLVRADFDGI